MIHFNSPTIISRFRNLKKVRFRAIDAQTIHLLHKIKRKELWTWLTVENNHKHIIYLAHWAASNQQPILPKSKSCFQH